MELKFTRSSESQFFAKAHIVLDRDNLSGIALSEAESSYVKIQLEEQNLVALNRYNEVILLILIDKSASESIVLEKGRKLGNELVSILRKEKIGQIDFIGLPDEQLLALAVAEGLALGSYQFLKYFSAPPKKSQHLEQINFVGFQDSETEIKQLEARVEAVFFARDLVNEPASHLNAVGLADSFKQMGELAGFKTEIFHKDKIEELNMGGLLAVNKGSIDPPTFSVLTWKPANAKNKKPIILVGKGVVYDTGGLSLKPTKDSMDFMKCDMAGGAVVASVLYYAAKTKLPLYVIALIPSTDNRPDGNAYAPGDVVVMHSGKTVEVLNTDAEGRMILADALSYAKDYDPELVIDVATLTGAAAVAIGQQGIVAMGTAGSSTFQTLKNAGEKVYERIVEFPLWDEYGDLIKSDIADLKNVGGREAGAITAGKFLEHFIAYPWIHLDIAGSAFLGLADHYRSKGGTGAGVRLLIDLVTRLA